MSAGVDVLQAAIGYSFRKSGLLRCAMTHKSYAHEQPNSDDTGPGDNEQLEFLGDAILGFLVSELVVSQCPALGEGQLSKLKAHLVSAAHLYKMAVRLNLGHHLRLGRGEERSGGRDKRTLLANAVEALIAAIYLDGGLEEARRFVLREVAAELDAGVIDSNLPVVDHKSALQEAVHMRGLPPPRYVLVKECGPGHAKTFTVQVRVGQQWSAEGEAPSKKSASQKAAQALLDQMKATAAS